MTSAAHPVLLKLNSIITMPELPGIGFEGKSDLIKVMRELAD